MSNIILWSAWSEAFSELRGAFSRQNTFFWAVIFCAGMSLRQDLRGVSSIVSVMSLQDKAYKSLLRVCHSSGVSLDKLSGLWLRLCFKLFRPICIEGYMVLLGDGIKVAKEGKKMPAVKLMHQESQSNSKAEYIMGHFLQALSLVVSSPQQNLAAIPLVARVHDGLVFTNSSKQTVITRFADLIQKICEYAGYPAIVVADAYYASSTLLAPLQQAGCELVCRVKHNAVAHCEPERSKKKKRGRPKKIGKRIVLKSLFDKFNTIATTTDDGLRYYCVNLYWKQAKRVMRFVLVDDPKKGRAILMSSKLDLDPLTIIKLYQKRWLIETGFKTAIHQLGTFAYHFWMKSMKPTRRGKTKQYLHRESADYRRQVTRKMKAFHVYIQLGCISQGLMLHLALNFTDQVWSCFNGWLRTIRKNIEPSELVVANALRANFGNFLIAEDEGSDWRKFMRKQLDLGRQGPLSRVA